MPETPYKALAAQLDEFLTQTNARNLVLGEDHTHSVLYLHVLTDPNVQAVLHKHGISEISLEARREFQPYADKVAAGTMSPGQMAQHTVDDYRKAGDNEPETARPIYQARAELIAATAKHGFNVHFSETQGTLVDQVNLCNMQQRTLKLQDKTSYGTAESLSAADKKRYQLASRFNDQAVMDEINRKRTDAAFQAIEKDPMTKKASDLLMQTRKANDPNLIRTIAEQTQGRGTVVVFGEAHGDNLRAGLGPHTAFLTLCVNHDEVVKTSEVDKITKRAKPDGYIDVGDSKIVNASGVSLHDDALAKQRSALLASQQDTPSI